MSAFVGELGGLLMIALIMILLYHFIADMGADKDRITGKKVAAYALPAVLLALLQIFAATVIWAFNFQWTPMFNIREIWVNEPFAQTFDALGNYSADTMRETGMMPLYYLVVGWIASLLYDMKDQCAFYISFLSGVVTYVSLGLLISHCNKDMEDGGKELTGQMTGLLYLLPGSVFLFIPSSFSMCIALMSVFLCVWRFGKGSKVAAIIFALLSVLTHLSGIATFIILLAGLLVKSDMKKAVLRDMGILAGMQLIIVLCFIANGWGSLYEYLFMFEIPVVLVLNILRVRIPSGVMSMTGVFLVVMNGFWVTGTIIGRV